MDLWFCSLLLPLSTAPRRVSQAAVESCPAFISYSMVPAGVVHRGLCRSFGAGHLDWFQVFAVENVRMQASQGALFSWLVEKGRCWVSLCSGPFYPPAPVHLLLPTATHSFHLQPPPQPVCPVPFILPKSISSHNCNPSGHLLSDLGPNSVS